MKRLRTLLCAALAAGWVRPAAALPSSADIGTSGGQFLRLAAGARDAALGEAAVADEQGPSALHYNPGAITSVPRSELGMLYADYLAGASYEYLGFVRKLGWQDAFGFSVTNLSYGDIGLRDAAGAPAGTAAPKDLAVAVGAAHWLTNPDLGVLAGASVGVTLQYVHSSLVDSASTLTGGFGLRSRMFMDERLRLGLSADNLFGSLKFDRQGDPLPAILRAGALWLPSPQIPAWKLLGELDFPRDQGAYPAVGTEYALEPVFLRAGWTGRLAGGGLGGLAGFSGGIGLSLKYLELDYALAPYGDLGSAHRVSITLKF